MKIETAAGLDYTKLKLHHLCRPMQTKLQRYRHMPVQQKIILNAQHHPEDPSYLELTKNLKPQSQKKSPPLPTDTVYVPTDPPTDVPTNSPTKEYPKQPSQSSKDKTKTSKANQMVPEQYDANPKRRL